MINVFLQLLIDFVSCFNSGRGKLPKYVFYVVDKLKNVRYPHSFENECVVQKIKQGKKVSLVEPLNKKQINYSIRGSDGVSKGTHKSYTYQFSKLNPES